MEEKIKITVIKDMFDYKLPAPTGQRHLVMDFEPHSGCLFIEDSNKSADRLHRSLLFSRWLLWSRLLYFLLLYKQDAPAGA